MSEIKIHRSVKHANVA
jgi:polo-like kinase 1